MRGKSINKLCVLFGITLLLMQCEETPEGIQRALFDDIAAQDIKLQLSMPIITDVSLTGNDPKANNGMANWGEVVYFDATLGNPLPESVSDVELEILGVNNTTHIVDWYDDRLDYGAILPTLLGLRKIICAYYATIRKKSIWVELGWKLMRTIWALPLLLWIYR